MKKASRKSWMLNVVAALAMLVAVVAFFWFAFASLSYEWEWARLWEYRAPLFRSWLFTILISALALIVSVVLGILLVLGQRSGVLALIGFCRGYVEIIRGTPLLVQILIMNYVIFTALNIHNSTVVGVTALACFSAAYLAEIFRGGIDSVARTQVDAARAVGFTRPQIYRYVIFPQAMRRVMPGIAGELVNLVKNSSLLMVISVGEFTKETYDFFSATYKGFEGFIMLGVGYLLLTLPITYLTYYLERKFRYES
ncbi:MAG: polar amino acid transport system permease protein [Verrucomicrobiales bacterium]|jgi:polar amino acid transport system permease protein